LRLVGVGLRPVVLDDAAAVALDELDELDERPHSVWRLPIAEVAAVELGLDRVHHHSGMHVVDPKIAVLIVAHDRQARRRAFLRLLGRDGAGLCGRMLILDDADGDLGEVLELELFLILQPEAHLLGFERYEPEQRDHAQRDDRVDLVADGKP
jgi:hypothetical protein